MKLKKRLSKQMNKNVDYFKDTRKLANDKRKPKSKFRDLYDMSAMMLTYFDDLYNRLVKLENWGVRHKENTHQWHQWVAQQGTKREERLAKVENGLKYVREEIEFIRSGPGNNQSGYPTDGIIYRGVTESGNTLNVNDLCEQEEKEKEQNNLLELSERQRMIDYTEHFMEHVGTHIGRRDALEMLMRHFTEGVHWEKFVPGAKMREVKTYAQGVADGMKKAREEND